MDFSKPTHQLNLVNSRFFFIDPFPIKSEGKHNFCHNKKFAIVCKSYHYNNTPKVVPPEDQNKILCSLKIEATILARL